MYRGFNIKNLSLTKDTYRRFYNIGLEFYNNNKQEVKKTLESFIESDGSLDGTAMRKNWFPKIDADIFISHSHRNEELAIVLSGWLYNCFGLKPFVDSCIWGNANDLIRVIDNAYCLQGDGLYSYSKRNHSTSHIHMMLSTALTMMIDNTECLFFLNTPDSISPTDVIDKTESPWIYSELAMTKLLPQKIPTRLKIISEERYYHADGSIEKGDPFIKHTVELEHLTEIYFEDLNLWQQFYKKGNALDTLYELNTILS